MPATTVLISGASIAGPTLAYWLRRLGFTPTVLERAPAPRPGGQAVDVRGVALTVAERMGVVDQLRAARTAMRGMSMVDETGAELMSTTEMSFTGGPTDSPDVEILRDDLSEILVRATSGVEYVYADAVTALDEDADGVRVTFERGAARTFDLVIGADGLHSSTRRLAFGPESAYIAHLNTYLAVFSAPNFLELDHWQVIHQSSETLAGVYSARDNAESRVMLGYGSPAIDYDHRDQDAQRRLIAEAFAGGGWEVPRLLEIMATAPDFYFDSMSQIHMERWSTGRIALVGDAAYCASPLSGQGTSLAMVGAYVLAGELAAADGDHTVAFARYEDVMREFVRVNQELALTNAEHMREATTERAAEQGKEHWVATAATAISVPDYGPRRRERDEPHTGAPARALTYGGR